MLVGEAPERVMVSLNDLKFEADLAGGHKTGLYGYDCLKDIGKKPGQDSFSKEANHPPGDAREGRCVALAPERIGGFPLP